MWNRCFTNKVHQNLTEAWSWFSVIHDSNNWISSKTPNNPQDYVTFDWPLRSRVCEEHNTVLFKPATLKHRGVKSKLELKSDTDYSLSCYMTLKLVDGCREAAPKTCLKSYSAYFG